MIRLGLRLTFGSGREAALRVLVTAAAVALGVGLLVATVAGANGLHAQTNRGAWPGHGGAGVTVDVGRADFRPVVVAVKHRSVR